MSGDVERCQACGQPRSNWLDGNCPSCLMGLATPVPAEEGYGKLAMPALDLERNRYLGDYELLGEIARGGMGVVYRARQRGLKRIVAVKVLLAAQFADHASLERFRREAEAAASLSHPNIVPIHEVGEHEGQPYFSMELIEGRSLAELTHAGPLPAREAAQLVKTIAEAVHFAHGRRVLHRDLKPSNVLIDGAGQPHITDFGLAKRLGTLLDSGQELPSLTVSGELLGTPNYMPPEQAEPREGPATPAGDVYSLGAILYHLLTGRPPFMAENLTGTLRLVAEGNVVKPRLLNPGLARDLETICLKALEKEPRRRYASAQELADELARFLRGEPIEAQPIGLPGRISRWCKRKPALALALGAVVTLLLLITLGSPIALLRINRARKLAETAQRETQQQLYTALLEQARATVLSGEMGQRVRAVDALRRAATITNSPDLRREALAALALPDLGLQRELPTGPQFTMVKLDPFFQRFACCAGNGPVEIRSASDGRELEAFPSEGGIVYLAKWSLDGRFLAVLREPTNGLQGATFQAWDTHTARQVLLAKDLIYRTMALHPYFPQLLAGGPQGKAIIWDLENGRVIARLTLQTPPKEQFTDLNSAGRATLDALAFSPDGQRLAAAYEEVSSGIVSVHRSTDGALLWSANLTNQITDLAWHPGERWLAATDAAGLVYLLDSDTGRYRVLGRHKRTAATATFSPEGAYLFTGGYERELRCWDLRSMELAFLIPADTFLLQLDTDGSQCALITKSGVQFHSLEYPTAVRELPGVLRGGLRSAAFSSDDRWLAVSDVEHMELWDLTTGGPGLSVAEGADARVFFPNERELITNGPKGSFRWGLESRGGSAGPGLQKLDLLDAREDSSVCFISNAVLLTSSKGSSLTPLESSTTTNRTWAPTAKGVNGVSPDGRWAAIFSPFGDVLHIYRLGGLEAVAHLTNQSPIRTFTFSPRGDQLAVTTRGRVEFWSTGTWERTGEFNGILDFFYAPNGGGWWLTKDYRSGGLYDSHSHQPLLPLPTGTLPLAVSHDGRYLAASVGARRVQVWDLVQVRRHLRELGMDWQDN